jgi:hypothetical protein
MYGTLRGALAGRKVGFALRFHPEGCPAHQSVKDAIEITWDALIRTGKDAFSLRG